MLGAVPEYDVAVSATAMMMYSPTCVNDDKALDISLAAVDASYLGPIVP